MCVSVFGVFFLFFFNDTATTEIYTLSLHDALPIYWGRNRCGEDSDSSGCLLLRNPIIKFYGFDILDRYAPSENRYFFTKNLWSLILSEIISQIHIGVVIDVVKFQILQVVCC